jgi:hypothetical protein
MNVNVDVPELVIGFTEHLQIALSLIHILCSPKQHSFISRCLVTNPNNVLSASVLTFLPTGDCPTPNSLLRLFYL